MADDSKKPPKKRGGNPAGNPGKRSKLLCAGILSLETTPSGFIIKCKEVKTVA